jgi:hypothetical protein
LSNVWEDGMTNAINYGHVPLPSPSSGLEAFWTTAQFIVAAAVLVFAVILNRRYRTVWPIMCVVGGALTAGIEPLIDVLCRVYWPHYRQLTDLSAFGRNVPMWTIPCYAYLMGFSSIMIWYWTQRGAVTKQKIAGLWVLMLVAINALEPIGLSLHLYVYNGQHGLRFIRYPVWYSTMFASVFVMASALAYRIKAYMSGWRVAGVVMLTPMINLGLFCAIGWPMFLALNGRTTSSVTDLCSVWVLIQALLVLYLAMGLIGLIKLPAPEQPGKRIEAEPAANSQAIEPVGVLN